MPKPTPIPPNTRRLIADDISVGIGRNEIARRHGVSPGTVTAIARANGLWFANCTQTATATQCRQLDKAAARATRAEQLWNTCLTEGYRQRDGKETRKARKASYGIYNLDRHHNGRYPSP